MAVEVVVGRLVDIDGGAAVALAAALVAAWCDDVHSDGLSRALCGTDRRRRAKAGARIVASIVGETLGGEADFGFQSDTLNRGNGREEGRPKRRGGVHAEVDGAARTNGREELVTQIYYTPSV